MSATDGLDARRAELRQRRDTTVFVEPTRPRRTGPSLAIATIEAGLIECGDRRAVIDELLADVRRDTAAWVMTARETEALGPQWIATRLGVSRQAVQHIIDANTPTGNAH
jgi:DNA-binding transcriptional regulator YiaG